MCTRMRVRLGPCSVRLYQKCLLVAGHVQAQSTCIRICISLDIWQCFGPGVMCPVSPWVPAGTRDSSFFQERIMRRPRRQGYVLVISNSTVSDVKYVWVGLECTEFTLDGHSKRTLSLILVSSVMCVCGSSRLVLRNRVLCSVLLERSIIRLKRSLLLWTATILTYQS